MMYVTQAQTMQPQSGLPAAQALANALMPIDGGPPPQNVSLVPQGGYPHQQQRQPRAPRPLYGVGAAGADPAMPSPMADPGVMVS